MLRYLLWLGCLGFAVLLYGQEGSQVTEPSSSTNEQKLMDQTLNFAQRHQEFKELYFKQNEPEFVRLVAEGQSPQILFIGCSDSRVVPDLILNTRPGDLFVIRSAGNFVPPYDPKGGDGISATIEYAIEVLNIPHIIVCGHSHCGAIQGLFKKFEPNQMDILQRWLRFGEEAKRMALVAAKPNTPQKELYPIAEQISVIYQLEHLMTFPFIKKRIDEGKLQLHGWYFRIETGELCYYDAEAYRFKPISASKLPVLKK